jgi:hypothetical protein
MDHLYVPLIKKQETLHKNISNLKLPTLNPVFSYINVAGAINGFGRVWKKFISITFKTTLALKLLPLSILKQQNHGIC